MRKVAIVLCGIALVGCAASRQEVQARLGAHFIGQSSDVLVKQWGPPQNSFKMQSGETSMVWQLGAVTDISGGRYSATAETSYCRVSVIANVKGIVTNLTTEDTDDPLEGSLCARRLGMQPG
jgi:hypothetical protein